MMLGRLVEELHFGFRHRNTNLEFGIAATALNVTYRAIRMQIRSRSGIQGIVTFIGVGEPGVFVGWLV